MSAVRRYPRMDRERLDQPSDSQLPKLPTHAAGPRLAPLGDAWNGERTETVGSLVASPTVRLQDDDFSSLSVKVSRRRR